MRRSCEIEDNYFYHFYHKERENSTNPFILQIIKKQRITSSNLLSILSIEKNFYRSTQHRSRSKKNKIKYLEKNLKILKKIHFANFSSLKKERKEKIPTKIYISREVENPEKNETSTYTARLNNT